MKLVYYVPAPGWTIKDSNYYTTKHTQNQEQMSKGTCVALVPCHFVLCG